MELMWNWKMRRKDGDVFSIKRKTMTSSHEGGEKERKTVKKLYNFVSY